MGGIGSGRTRSWIATTDDYTHAKNDGEMLCTLCTAGRS